MSTITIHTHTHTHTDIYIIIYIYIYIYICWFIGWIQWHINLCRLLNAKSIFMQNSVLFQTINSAYVRGFDVKTVLFQAVQFSMITI